MLRCAKEFGSRRASPDELGAAANTPLPGIAALRDGGFLILGKVGDDKVLVQYPLSPRPATDDPRASSRRSGTAGSC